MAMKVRIEFSGAKNDPGDEYQERCNIDVDGKRVVRGGDFSDCPEDANLGRALDFIYKLPAILRCAHTAGYNGEPFELEEVENYE
jgi:hypothetical protein